jgi:hypothetical protein
MLQAFGRTALYLSGGGPFGITLLLFLYGNIFSVKRILSLWSGQLPARRKATSSSTLRNGHRRFGCCSSCSTLFRRDGFTFEVGGFMSRTLLPVNLVFLALCSGLLE